MAQRFNLSAFDWDDTALIKAYDRGMSLKAKNLKKEDAKENLKKGSSRRRPEWKVGDHCRAIYSGDNSWYEAKIVAIDGDRCTVDFIGYHEEAEVELSALDQSLGKREIKKQKREAKDSYIANDLIDEVASADETKHDETKNEETKCAIQSSHSHSRRRHCRHNETHMLDQSNYGPAESTFHSAYPMARYSEVPSNTYPMPRYPEVPRNPMVPPAAIAPPCAEIHDPALRAMITAWYSAGYYTALSQVKKDSPQPHCCCHQTHHRHQ